MARELCEEEKSNEMVVAGGGFYYNSNLISNNNIERQLRNEIGTGFGSGTGAEMFNNLGNSNGSTVAEEFHENIMVVGVGVGAWGGGQDNNNNRFHRFDDHNHDDDDDDNDDSSLRCVFPCEANERPSQGLSLSLSSSNPSSIGLQSFELRPQLQLQQQQQQTQSVAMFQLRNSRFLAPAQELLYEFCSLGITNTNNRQHQQVPLSSSDPSPKDKGLNNRPKQWDFQDASSSSAKLSLHSLDFIELQKRKTKLFSMLEEVERRYKHYCEQMKAVVASFESVAGSGAASVYSALASKAMSRHFRCLKDGILGQIHATKKAMGENKEPIAPGTSRGETPRLRVIDQALRQHRAFHQITMMETHPWRPQRGLPERSVSVLRAWLFEHFLHPYPSDVDKHILARQTGLSRSQVSNWFINARVRLWKPMVEEMYLEETKEQEDEIKNSNFNNNNNGNNSSDGMADFEDDIDGHHRPIPTRLEDQKPTPDQLLRIDSECLSSIISNTSEKNNSRTMKAMQNHHQHHLHSHTFGRVSADTFGTVELDFSSYNHHSGTGGISYPNHNINNNQNFNNGGSGGGVSLTLGLQHAAAGGNGGGGVSIAFSPAAAQSSLFFTRDHMEECQPVQYSILDGETQNLPYRNLMGAQLLHDLAG